MLRRFRLYGFLENQRGFEPFLILAFMDRGLSFFVIGLLIAFREVATNLFDVPSRMVADPGWSWAGSISLSWHRIPTARGC